jgi:hypothetical protein
MMEETKRKAAFSKRSRIFPTYYFEFLNLRYLPVSVFVLLYCTLMSAQPASSLSAEQIIRRHIAAIGGEDNLRKIADRSIHLSGTYAGANVAVEIYQKAPDKYLSKLSFGFLEQIIRFDGKDGIKLSSIGEETLAGDDLLRLRLQADILALTHLSQLGITPVLDSIVTADNSVCYKVKFMFPSGNYSSAFYDTTTFFKIREESVVRTENGSYIQSTVFSDFRPEEGVIYPRSFLQSIGDKKVITSVNGILVNTGIKDSFFEENISIDP